MDSTLVTRGQQGDEQAFASIAVAAGGQEVLFPIARGLVTVVEE